MFLNSALISEITLQLRMAFEKLDQQLLRRFNEVNDLSKQEQQGAEEDYKTIQEQWEKDKILHKVKRAVESSRAAAKTLDDVWAKYQMAHAWGSLAGIIGGGLTIGLTIFPLFGIRCGNGWSRCKRSDNNFRSNSKFA